jgi:hypothetical protein
MSEGSSTATLAADKPIDLKHFLEDFPPESSAEVLDKLLKYHDDSYALAPGPIQLHCDSPDCDGIHWFDHSEGTIYAAPDKWKAGTVVYICRHCERSWKAFALYAKLKEDFKTVAVYKIGEYPPFGPHTPSRVITLIGPDQDLFLKGRRAENRSLGIGAFAYYRRVVENQKDRIIQEIEKVGRRLNAKPEMLATLEAARKETQFKKSMEMVKDAIPESLLISGHNPLTLLHTALSRGLHAQDDATCLGLARDIRIVLTDLAEKISAALKEQTELTQALSRILQENSKKESGA